MAHKLHYNRKCSATNKLFRCSTLESLLSRSHNFSCKSEMCRHFICLVLACTTLSAKAESRGTVNQTDFLHRHDSSVSIFDLTKNKTFANSSHSYEKTPKNVAAQLSQHQFIPNSSNHMFDVSMEGKHIIIKLFTKYHKESFISVKDLHKLLTKIKERVLTSHGHHHTVHTSEHDELEPTQDLKVTRETTSETVGDVSVSPSNLVHTGDSQLEIGQQMNKTDIDTEHCLRLDEMLHIFKFSHLKRLGPREFLHLCPVLIDQLDSGFCKAESELKVVPILEDPHDNHQHHEHDHSSDTSHDVHVINATDTTPFHAPMKAWCFTFLSIIIISVCCVVGAIIIPNMEKVFYNHILQFLVALAVGAMSSDAMLHLLPHALLSESHHANHHHKHDIDDRQLQNDTKSGKLTDGQTSSHMTALYKGLVALMGMYGFFFLERCFTHFTQHRGRKTKSKSLRKTSCNEESRSTMLGSTLEAESFNMASCDAVVMVVHPNKALKAYADVRHEALLHSCDESLILSPSGSDVTGAKSGGNGTKNSVIGSISDAVVTRKASTILAKNPASDNTSKSETNGHPSPCEKSGHGDAICLGAETTRSYNKTTEHCHSHRNVGNLREVLSSVAMMVVVGDLIHSFCAGLAIGTAYAGNTLGGLSTSVAVFCYELPHEIGDLAVLMRSGLTRKKAVCFNLLSSLPSFFGAIIGLSIGNIGSASVWSFAGVGGMFLYITLVDLVPEMTSVYTKPGEPWFLHLLLQAIGISVGTTLVLIISVSEESRTLSHS
ncbi:zinc transporter ZIP10-like [Biomphalaria glabrata]|uniref:Zinc transporter ZIP10-like n=1 Tax=Biomphalaria glabrata TaxID=6526 RepID=A0A9W2YCZ5_BIOGL|nr:zinc transporter ZIP10-like [Biomphalaria glabrata]XP_055860604.1 zinc transporter ZIP10-like [Biomphalaria glabrata]